MHRDFLRQLMEAIGVNLSTIVANARTDELLQESQRLADELRARSEELQVRQEELQRSNAELEEKAALLADRNHDIEAKNAEIEQARQELETRAQQLSLASKYKSEFLANMSHELRTPLNSLLILAQLLAQNPTRNLTPKQVEYATIIHSAGSDLLQLINDILDLSKVEAGKMALAPERVALRQLIDYMDATFRPMTTQKSLDFEIVTASDAPAELLTDDSRLRQILRNLLSNAVKFTETGGVEVRIERAATAEVPEQARHLGEFVAFRVCDTGIGIAEEQLEAIFAAFQQADGTTSRKYGGTGLGLSISREMAQLLGGAISVRSTLGRGSTFTLLLPVARPDFHATAAPALRSTPEPDGASRTSPAVPAPAVADRAAPRRVLVLEPRVGGLMSVVTENAAGTLGSSSPGASNHRAEVVTVLTAEEAAAALAAGPFHCVVVDGGMADGSDQRFLDAVSGDPALQHVPVLVHAPARASAADHLAAARATSSVEVLSGLDDLRERVALHLTAEYPGAALPLVRPDETAVAPAPPTRANWRAASCWWWTTTPATSTPSAASSK
ncbi:sensor histidine kinase [Streptacidiphilus monticola]